MTKEHLTLVGAGPGDPDLISVKGIKALADADVVLFDALVHPDILNYAPDRAEVVFVGKRKGVCQFKQEDINRLIVEYAKSHGHVVRLKGGDPYVFGRGHEEIEHAKAFNIPYTVIPGISSCFAVPELQGIPLTRRGFNESFWVVTGTTRNHELSGDVKIAARSEATVVILMGMHKLDQIVAVFEKEGKAETPVAIIQNGSRDDEQIGIGTVETITEVVSKKQLSSPAVIVIGEVVRLHPEYVKELAMSAAG